MSGYFYFLLGELIGRSICFAAIIGIIRFRKIPTDYRPFVYFTWLALANEFISSYSVARFKSNAVDSNLYVYFESLLILWLFNKWSTLPGKKIYYRVCGGVFTAVWIFDNLIVHSADTFNSLFRVVYSFVLVVLSIDHINYIFFNEKRNILTNSSFLISLAFLAYFSFKGLFEFFFIFRLTPSLVFYDHVLLTINAVNLLANLTYALAMLWIREKQTFILPY